MNISPPSHKYTCMFLILGTAYIYAIIYIDITLVFFSLIWHRSFFFLPTTLIFVINGFPIWSKFITSISSSTTPNTDCASIFNHLWNYTSPSTHFILYACSRILVIVCPPPPPSSAVRVFGPKTRMTAVNTDRFRRPYLIRDFHSLETNPNPVILEVYGQMSTLAGTQRIPQLMI